MKNIKNKSDEALIRIVETPESYQELFYEAACVELPLREINDEFLYQVAEDIYKEKVQKMLRKSFLNTEGFELPHSAILSEEQKTALFKEEFEFNQGRRGDLYEGLDKYMLGG